MDARADLRAALRCVTGWPALHVFCNERALAVRDERFVDSHFARPTFEGGKPVCEGRLLARRWVVFVGQGILAQRWIRSPRTQAYEQSASKDGRSTVGIFRRRMPDG